MYAIKRNAVCKLEGRAIKGDLFKKVVLCVILTTFVCVIANTNRGKDKDHNNSPA